MALDSFQIMRTIAFRYRPGAQMLDWRGERDSLQVFLSKDCHLISSTSGIDGDWVSVTQIKSLPPGEGAKLCQFIARFYPFMGGDLDIAPPSLYLKDLSLKRMTFFGGSFNPWHMGHRMCLDLCPMESLLVLPDNNPWKGPIDRECPWQFFQQLAANLAETSYSLYPGFLALTAPNPTVHWLPLVNVTNKWLLVGDDTFLGLAKWKDTDKLLSSVEGMYVCPRLEGSSALEQNKEELLKMAPHLQFIFLGHHEYEHLSSTQLRP
jgi:nicotinate-nucleotide adenylyltransferase